MATVDRVLQLKLIADVSNVGKQLAGTQSRLKKLGSAAAAWSKAFAFTLILEGISKVGEALTGAWEGFREGEKAAAQLGNTWNNLGLKGAKLQGAIDQISARAKELGTDDTEAINAFNKALLATGDQEQAMRRLGIAQNLVASGMATNLTGALKLVDGAAKGSSSTVRKFGLTAETAGGRVKELGRKVKGAADKAAAADPLKLLFNSLSEDLEGIVGSLATGDIEGAMASLGQVGTDLGLAWDGVYPAIQGALDTITNGAFSDFANNVIAPLVSRLQEFGDNVGPIFNQLLADANEKFGQLVDVIGPKITPLLDSVVGFVEAAVTAFANLKSALQPVIDLIWGAATGTLGAALDEITGILDAITLLLNGDFTGAWNKITETVGKVIDDVKGVLNDLVDDIGKLVPDFLAAAGDVGDAVIKGITDAIDGAVDTVVGSVRGLINSIIDVWNTFDLGIPKGEFQFWGPGSFGIPNPLGGYIAETKWDAMKFTWAGSGDMVPDLPHLAKGGIVTDPTVALIGEAGPEAVVPLDQYGGGGATVNIHVNGDPAVIKAAVLEALRGYVGANGQLRLNGFQRVNVAGR